MKRGIFNLLCSAFPSDASRALELLQLLFQRTFFEKEKKYLSFISVSNMRNFYLEWRPEESVHRLVLRTLLGVSRALLLVSRTF